MSDPAPSMPRLGRQPVSVDFIDNHLPRYHTAYVNPPARYNSVSGKYVLDSHALVPTSNSAVDAAPSVPPAHPGDSVLPPRPAWTNTKAMAFWNDVFPLAMTQLKGTAEPRGRSGTDYDIRVKDSWEAVYDTLEASQTAYQSEDGPKGWLRKHGRRLADNITPVAKAVSIASKVVPSNAVATPVLGAVQVLLDAVKNAASIRKQALEGFDGLIPIFSDVELFVGTFPADPNIRTASVDLIVTILDSVERAIGFFLSNEFLRGTKATFTGDDYGRSLLQSLDLIKTKSKSLMEEAVKSHIHGSQMYSQETQKILKQVVEGQERLNDGLFNSFEHLLADHIRMRDQLNAAQQEVIYLRIQNNMLEHSRLTPSPPPQTPVREWCISQEALRRMLDTRDVDLSDAAFVLDRRAQLPAGQRAQAEQIVNTALFRDWMVSPRSARLLVQWDGAGAPQTVAAVSPLSVFCATMARALRARARFVAALWFCGRHAGGARGMLASLADQLLRQHAFDTRPLHREVSLAALQAGDPDQSARLLAWLVRRLPEASTLVCVVDGVVLCERDEFAAEALPALAGLLRLAGDPSVPAAVKVLFASTPGTDIVRAAFEGEDLILSVSALPQLASAPSDERMARELDGGLGAPAVELEY